ncbi:CSEP0360 putative effector protein [Blumeria hordei DH14]|uniref:CSEP0360 putative effector protein n=1 Tax=Blumeria graminis f. sp. hordei (strain DH14) TaxID=546991 RepID=N1JA77_BLUG1|nr:CSEP0360 putative effector protein [Blumeria hordei DH14]
MKFFNAPMTVALAAITLLVPSTHALFQFNCISGESLDEHLVRSDGEGSSPDNVREDDPPAPSGEWYGVKKFKRQAQDGRYIDYLVQRLQAYPNYILYEWNTDKWEECTMKIVLNYRKSRS